MPVTPPPALDQRAVVVGLVRWALRFAKIADFEQKRAELRRVVRRIPVIGGAAPSFDVCGAFWAKSPTPIPHSAQDRRVRADANGERHGRRKHKQRVTTQIANGVAKALRETRGHACQQTTPRLSRTSRDWNFTASY
jgi:hypothetical protein